MNLSGFKRFKEEIEEIKLFLEHHQTVALISTQEHSRGPFWCPSTNF